MVSRDNHDGAMAVPVGNQGVANKMSALPPKADIMIAISVFVKGHKRALHRFDVVSPQVPRGRRTPQACRVFSIREATKCRALSGS